MKTAASVTLGLGLFLYICPTIASAQTREKSSVRAKELTVVLPPIRPKLTLPTARLGTVIIEKDPNCKDCPPKETILFDDDFKGVAERLKQADDMAEKIRQGQAMRRGEWPAPVRGIGGRVGGRLR